MENISQMSLLEVALEIMEEKGGIVNIYELIAEVLKRKGLEDSDGSLAAKLYIDITTSSKFVYMGEDNWDLKARQSLDQFDKDGSSFNSKDFVDDAEDEEEGLDEEDLDEEDLEDEDEEDRDEDEDDEDRDDDDEDEESEYVDEEDEESEDEDDDRSIDEDKYNEYMDDYEDLYEA